MQRKFSDTRMTKAVTLARNMKILYLVEKNLCGGFTDAKQWILLFGSRRQDDTNT
jgi:hypothetical protein